MKKMIFLLFFAATTACCFSQNAGNTTPVIKKDYLQKSKNQKAAAWFLLGAGTAIDIVGFAVYPKQAGFFLTDAEQRQERTSLWLFVAGTTTMLSSIPFFITGHINKKKAVQVTMNTQLLRQLKNSSLYTVNYPALTMKIRFMRTVF